MLLTDLVKIFYVFSSEDEQSTKDKKRLDQHFTFLREREIVNWQDYEFLPGTPLNDQVEAYLKNADIILFLLSPDYLASYKYSEEADIALARQAKGEAHVIPIILRSCDWRGSKFSKLSPLPQNGKGIFPRPNLDDVCLEVKRAINRVIDEWLIKREINQQIVTAITYYKQELYEDALEIYNQALSKLEKISFRQDKPDLLRLMGDTLYKLQQDNEALQRYDEAIRLTQHNSLLYKNKSEVLLNLGQWENAIAVCNAALDLISLPEQEDIAAQTHANKGLAYLELKQLDKALDAFNSAIEKNRHNALFWQYRGDVCCDLGDEKQTKASYDQAVALAPDDPYLHCEYGSALQQFELFREAQDQYELAIQLKPNFAYAYQRLHEVFISQARLAQEKYECFKDEEHNLNK